jgi:type I restriction-modification system DNA methylase subunit
VSQRRKQEIDRADPYNKKLFLRIARGVYVVNPDLDIFIGEDQWMNAYQMMFTEKMTVQRNEAIKQENLERITREFKERVKKAEARDAAQRRREEEEWRNRWKW